MKTFSKKYLSGIKLHPSTAWPLSQCTEARGMQALWQKTRPEILKKLRESAIVQSAESSNRIEGVEVEKYRLIPLVLGRAKPKDRPEEEVQGYRRALSYIFKNFKSANLSPELIRRLHVFAQEGTISDFGKWKSKDNQIIELNPEGECVIHFECLGAKETPKAIEQLCLGYEDVLMQNALPDLIAISGFVLDFLCIHPFRDGNGRISRLLTSFLLCQNQYEVSQYISLERIIEDSKEDYYDALKKSSEEWHQGKHNITPWCNYFLGVVKMAYQELRTRVELSSQTNSKTDIIKQLINELTDNFSVSDICNLDPTLNRELVKKVLSSLSIEGKIKLVGKGRGAKWVKKMRE